MTTLTIPRQGLTGCLSRFPVDMQAWLLHTYHAAKAEEYAYLASASDICSDDQQHYRERARHYAALAREYFARWIEVRR